MATTAPTNQRANLLSGLRTGGVRATSMATPHTAGVTGSFHVPRFASSGLANSHFPEEDADELADTVPQALYTHPGNRRQAPMTASVDGRFMQPTMNHNAMPFHPTYGGMHNQAQAQALQMQMMQMEIMRLQALQAQQYQAELIAQAQRQQQQQSVRRFNNVPASAGPMTTSFDGQMRRTSQASQLRAQLGLSNAEDQVPMTAGLSGKFGSRVQGTGSPKNSDEESEPKPLQNASRVISGGTSLGSPVPTTPTSVTVLSGTSKADGASSWRRGGNNNSVLSGNNSGVARSTSPTVTITPPPADRASPPPAQGSPTQSAVIVKARPTPLQFDTLTKAEEAANVAIDAGDLADESDSCSTGSASSKASSPVTPSSNESQPPLSPREEAAKKLYEGLGLGRPAVQAPGTVVVVGQTQQVARIASQAVRQPRGPPSGADELGPKNFATRIRRKAIGGLGALLDARERREIVAF